MPLVRADGQALEDPLSEAHGRARKIDPTLTEGELVRVAGGRNQAEAELIQGLLLEWGVPSVLRRTAGFDVPDFLAAGPRDVLVPESGAETAHEVPRHATASSLKRPSFAKSSLATPRASAVRRISTLLRVDPGSGSARKST